MIVWGSIQSIKFTMGTFLSLSLHLTDFFCRESTQNFLPSPRPQFFPCHLVKVRLSFIITPRVVILKINGSLYTGLKCACFSFFLCSPLFSNSFQAFYSFMACTFNYNVSGSSEIATFFLYHDFY